MRYKRIMSNWLKVLKKNFSILKKLCIKLKIVITHKIMKSAMKIDVEKIRTIKESKKGAALVEYNGNGKGVWLSPSLVEAIKDGKIFLNTSLQLSLEYAMNNAEIMDKEELAGKNLFFLIKGTMVEEREKAILWCCEDRENVWFPKSQITHNEDEIIIPLWLAKNKEEEEDWVIPKNARKIWR